jgi:hypothetical protein
MQHARRYFNQTYVLYLMMKKKYGTSHADAVSVCHDDLSALINAQAWGRRKLEQELVVYVRVG